MRSAARWIKAKFDARRRAFDIQILWPICKREAETLDQAKAAFAVHAFHDDAWVSLGHDGIVKAIDALN